MSAIVSDRFGIEIEANNEGFELEAVKAFLAEIGGEDIEEHYYPE